MEPVLAIRLMEFEISTFTLGLIFVLREVGYTVSLLIMSHLNGEDRNINRQIIFWGLLFTGFCHFLIGPAVFLPNSIIVMVAGQFLFALGTGVYFIPILPEMLKIGIKKYPQQQIEVSDMTTGVFNFML